MGHKTIHVFYACDEIFLKYTVVSITSLIENASKKYNYKIHILHTDIHSEAKKLILARGLGVTVIGDGDTVNSQVPAANTKTSFRWYNRKKSRHNACFFDHITDHNHVCKTAHIRHRLTPAVYQKSEKPRSILSEILPERKYPLQGFARGCTRYPLMLGVYPCDPIVEDRFGFR